MKSVTNLFKLLKWIPCIYAFTVVLSNTCFADGGFVGTPSGGFCKVAPGKPANKACETFAQAGVRVKSNSNDKKWIMPEELLIEIVNVVDKLPISDRAKKIMLHLTLGTEHTFTPVDEKNKDQADAAKLIYIKAFESFMSADELSRIEIFQVSTSKETFIFPEFDSLNLRGMALSMIHEAAVRGRDLSILPSVLEYDGLIQDWLMQDPAKKANFTRFYRLVDLTCDLFSCNRGFQLDGTLGVARYPYQEEIRMREFLKLVSETSVMLPLNDFCFVKNHDGPKLCLSTREQVLKFAYSIGIEKDQVNQIKPLSSLFLHYNPIEVIKLSFENFRGGNVAFQRFCDLASRGQTVLTGFHFGKDLESLKGVVVNLGPCFPDSTGKKYFNAARVD